MSGTRTIRITSDTIDDAIRRAESVLKIPKEQLKIKVIQQDSKGLIGKKKAILEFTFDPREQEQRAREHEILKFVALKITSKGIYLKVDQVPQDLMQAAPRIVRKYLHEQNILEVDRTLLKKIIDLQCGKYILLQKTDVYTIGDARISVFTTSNKTVATLIRFDLEPLDRDLLLKYLQERNITFGLKDDIVNNLHDERFLNTVIIIAEGTMPMTEQRAPLEYHFDPDSVSLKVDDSDKIDFKNIIQLTAVKKGQLLAEKTDPIPGKPGTSIDGKEIPFEIERDVPISYGKGVYVDNEGRTIHAEINGHIVFEYGIVSVEPIYIVEGNVDYHTGNIEFDGGVIVRGDILPGFKVSATGKVEVHGVIDDGVVETEGSLIVRHGIFSKGKGYIKIGGTLLVKHIEDMDIEADIVRVHSNIINARIKARDYVEVYGDPGTIIGGTTEAKTYIKANTIGSPIGNKTYLVVGQPEDIHEKISELLRRIEDKKRSLDEHGPAKSATVSATAVRTTELYTQQGVEEIEAELAALRKEKKRLRLAKIHFRDNIHEGVSMRIYTDKMTIMQAQKHGSIVWEDDKVKIIHYHYREGV